MERETSRHLLVLARHGQSEGNQRNIFTGWQDLPLTVTGETEALRAGRQLREQRVVVDSAFTSLLSRTRASCELMLQAAHSPNARVTANQALNERDYGDLTGLNKDQARERFGADQVQLWRRDYATTPPNGESLRDTVARVLPFFLSDILPTIMRSRGTLVVAHGNSLRALIMALERLTPAEISKVELSTGEMRHYTFGADAAVITKGIWKAN